MPAIYKAEDSQSMHKNINRAVTELTTATLAIKEKIKRLEAELKAENPKSFFNSSKEKMDKKSGLQYILDNASIANIGSIEAETLEKFPKIFSGLFSETQKLVGDYLHVLKSQQEALRKSNPHSEGNKTISNTDL